MRKSFAVFLLTALAIVVPLRNTEAAVLDQSEMTGTAGVSSGLTLAQTFTVGVSGNLSSVELQLATIPGHTDPIDLMIATTSGGLPTSTILGESIVDPGVVINQWVSFDFSPGIPVYAGETLAIELPPPTNSPQWNGDAADTYSGGLAYVDLPSGWVPGQADFTPSFVADFDFQTFVTPAPEPSSLALLAVGAAGLLLASRRRKA